MRATTHREDAVGDDVVVSAHGTEARHEARLVDPGLSAAERLELQQQQKRMVVVNHKAECRVTPLTCMDRPAISLMLTEGWCKSRLRDSYVFFFVFLQ